MKLLLDENLPHVLRHEISGHDCYTVAYMGWGGVANGDLLRRARADRFDALLTMDTNFQYEQNPLNLPLAVVVLHSISNDIDELRPLIPALLTALLSLAPNQIMHVR
jgi:hypothetical protein